MRISRFLIPTTWLIGQFICLQAASAQTVTEEKVANRLWGVRPQISTSYLRSAADENSAYYQSVFAAEVKFKYELPETAQLTLTTGVSRNLDALEERYVWSTTSLKYSSKPYELDQNLKFTYAGTLVAPTNSDMREYLSYQGSLKLGAGVTRSLTGLSIGKSLDLSLTGGGSRNFFEYDSTQAGSPNTALTLSTGLAAAFELTDMFSFSGSYGLTKAKKTNSTWKDTVYDHRIAAGVKLTDELSVSLSESTQNRAFSYDAQTTQFALYDYQTTIYEMAATYIF